MTTTDDFLSQEIIAAAKLNQSLAVGRVLYRHRRTSNSSSTTTEAGVIRLDGCVLKLGRLYIVRTGPIASDGDTAANYIGARLRGSNSGTATTASTQLNESKFKQADATAPEKIPACESIIVPTSTTETWSFLVSVVAFAGTPNVTIQASATAPLDLFVIDCGPDPGSTGTNL